MKRKEPRVGEAMLSDIGETPIDVVINENSTVAYKKRRALRDGFAMMNIEERITPGSSDDQANSMTHEGGYFGPAVGNRMTSDERIASYIRNNYQVGDENIKGPRILNYDAEIQGYKINIERTLIEIYGVKKERLESDSRTRLYSLLEIENTANEDLLTSLVLLREGVNEEEVYELIEDEDLKKGVKGLKESLPTSYRLKGDLVVDLRG